MSAESSKGAGGGCEVCGLARVPDGQPCPRCGGDPSRTWAAATRAAAARAAAAHAPGETAAGERYEVLEQLGHGSMGIVYKVRDREIDEVIAIKVLAPRFSEKPEAVAQFKAELRLARRINHPNVARVFDLVSWRGRLAISQEFIEGTPLDQLLKAGPLAMDRLLRHARCLCSAIDAAHRIGVVHRDLKPGNIMIDRDGDPRILDFGVAGEVDPEAGARELVVGTPLYMAPEQAVGKSPDPRSDLYSLGVILFEMSTGRTPFTGGVKTLLEAHRSLDPPRPSELRPELSKAFDEVILRALSKRPELRHESARALFAELEASGVTTVHSRGVVPPRALPPAARGKVLVVDDEADVRALLKVQLGDLHLMVIEASHGQAGVEAALVEKPDLVLLDLVMPVLDGRDVLRILKSNPATAEIPVVILTHVTDPEEALFAKDLGAAMFLNKPAEPDILELVAERFLGAEGRDQDTQPAS